MNTDRFKYKEIIEHQSVMISVDLWLNIYEKLTIEKRVIP